MESPRSRAFLGSIQYRWRRRGMVPGAAEVRTMSGGEVILDNFRDLYFGEAANETEVRKNEDRFFRTYLDNWSLRDRFLDESFFLILGPKGAGKTAIGQYLRLLLEDLHGQECTFSTTRNLDDAAPNVSALSSLTSKLVSADTAGVTKASWKLFFAIEFINLVAQDNGSSLQRDSRFNDLLLQLRRADLAKADFPLVLRKVRENKFILDLKFLKNERSSNDSMIRAASLGQELLDYLYTNVTHSHYILIIDGLDRIISSNSAYWLSLASLLSAGMEVHNQISRASDSMHLLIMCRSDVFRKVAYADADKITDVSLFVDWATSQTQPRDSALWDYIAKKAEIAVDDLFSTLPDTVEVGKRSEYGPRSLPTVEYLLHSTRSTPREMTMLMKRLQEVVPQRGRILGSQVRQAVDNFASRDLLTIILAEASGLLDDRTKEALPAILGCLPHARRFTRDDLITSMKDAEVDDTPVRDLAQFLFLAGAIGNSTANGDYVQFYHRRDTYAFRPSGPWTLHKALMYALNVPW